MGVYEIYLKIQKKLKLKNATPEIFMNPKKGKKKVKEWFVLLH